MHTICQASSSSLGWENWVVENGKMLALASNSKTVVIAIIKHDYYQ